MVYQNHVGSLWTFHSSRVWLDRMYLCITILFFLDTEQPEHVDLNGQFLSELVENKLDNQKSKRGGLSGPNSLPSMKHLPFPGEHRHT